MSEHALGAVKLAVSRLLKTAKIGKTIRVDDLYAVRTIEDIIADCERLGAEAFSSLPPIAGVAWTKDDPVWRDLLRARWPQVDEEQRTRLSGELRRRLDEKFESDRNKADVLEELLGDTNFLRLSFTQWREGGVRLAEAGPGERVLILFDQDMSHDGGTPDEGIKQIQNIIANAAYSSVVCCLLTHAFTPGQEENEWQGLAKAHGIPEHRFMVISNARLETDTIGFAQMLKLTILAPVCTALVERLTKVLARSVETAHLDLGKLSVYDFDFVVFRHSNNEGIWEPDTLIRLFSMHLRKNTLREAMADADLRRLSEEFRSVSGIGTKSDMEPVHRHAKEIQRFELYETKELLNELHLPIDLGDLFEKTSSGTKKKFILIAQPCDLMVRSSGTSQ